MMDVKPAKTKEAVTIVLLGVILAASFVAALCLGSTSVSDIFEGLFGQEASGTAQIILRYIRLPRAIAALLAGVGLSVSGVLLQSVTGNDLASPSIIGVNAGAGFLVILALSFGAGVFSLPFAAFAGAFLTSLLILFIGSRIDTSRSTIIFAGIACTVVLNAGISFLSMLDTDVLSAYNYFSIGGVAGVNMQSLLIPAVAIALCLAAALLTSRSTDLMCLGDAMAVSLGLRVKRFRIICLVIASASAASVVSFAGLLGFVGLVVPHIARRLVGHRTKVLLVTSALIGGALVLLADLVGRTLFAPSELPVGIVMALIGAPFFLVLLLKRRRAGC